MGIYGGFFFFFFSSRRRHTRCGRDWSSDVCSSDLTPVRAHVLGPRWRMDLARGGFVRKFSLRPARNFALVHGEYRCAPCPPLVQPHPLLPPAAGAARPPGASRRESTDPASELSLRAPCALG